MMGWLDVPFQTDSSGFDEKQIRDDSPETLTQLLAEAKAVAVAAKYPGAIIIGGDAVVNFAGRILEKPVDKHQQREMLDVQKGKTGKVYASVCVIDTGSNQKVIKTDTVSYKMPALTDEQIEAYVASGKGLDKAGGFGLQDDNGLFIEKLDGCFSAAMGFPICQVAGILQQMGVTVRTDIKQVAEAKTGRACF